MATHIRFDPEADAAYVRIVDKIGAGEAVQQVQVEDERLRGEVYLDLDKDGFLLGVEILYATDQLRSTTLQMATLLTGDVAPPPPT